MTVSLSAVTDHPQPLPAGTQRPALEPEERGSLTIDPSVLRKIAERIADRTPGTLPARRTVGVGSTGATAKAIVTGARVELRVELALRYPSPVRSTVEQLRRRIGDEVTRITGYQVGSITVTVTALLPEPSPGPR